MREEIDTAAIRAREGVEHSPTFWRVTARVLCDALDEARELSLTRLATQIDLRARAEAAERERDDAQHLADQNEEAWEAAVALRDKAEAESAEASEAWTWMRNHAEGLEAKLARVEAIKPVHIGSGRWVIYVRDLTAALQAES